LNYRYEGIDKSGKFKSGIVAAKNEVEALSKIKERDEVFLITNLSKQSGNKVIQKILTFKDKQNEKVRNYFIESKKKSIEKALKKEEKPSILERLKNINLSMEVSNPIKKITRKNEKKDRKKNINTEEGREVFEELVNIFNSEAFKELREKKAGPKAKETKQVIGYENVKEGKSIDWELLRNRREIIQKQNSNKNEKIKVKRKDILLFTKRLQIMLASGMTLVKSLTVLANGKQKRGLSTLIRKLIESLQSGNTFSESLSLFPKQFDYFYVSLVSIGESSGTIHEILLDIIKAMEQEEKINKKLKTAMVYPILMGVVLIAILLLGSLFFIPAFEDMFISQGLQLPKITRITFAVAGKMPIIIGSLFMIAFILFILNKTVPFVRKKLKRIRDALLLKIPIIRTIKKISYMYNFSSTVSLMLKNGIRLKDSLEMGKETINNTYIKEEINDMSTMMTEGIAMSEAMEYQKHFDEIITNVALTGEESGNMSFSLEQISDYYKREMEKAIETAMEFVEPLSIILIALIVLPVVLAIYLPILDISSGATLDI
jgi:type IV pilus assembly protein PilC